MSRCTYQYIPFREGQRTPAGDEQKVNSPGYGYGRKRAVPAGEVIPLLNGQRSAEQQRRVDAAALQGRITRDVFAPDVDREYGKGYAQHLMHEEAARRGIVLTPLRPD